MTFPKPSYRRDKAAAKRRESKADRAVYAAVDARDEFACRVCDMRCDPTLSPVCARSWHRHHIIFRSQGGVTSTANVVGLCGATHRAVHAGALHISGNADETLRITWAQSEAV